MNKVYLKFVDFSSGELHESGRSTAQSSNVLVLA